MGETSTDTRREIEELRAQTTALLTDMEYQARQLLDVQAQIQEHPGIAAGVGLALAGGVGLIAFAIFRSVQERRSTRYQAQQRLKWVAEHLSEGLPLRLNVQDGRVEIPMNLAATEREPSVMQRVAWSLLATGGTALASYLARQLTESIWLRGFGEPPPSAGGAR